MILVEGKDGGTAFLVVEIGGEVVVDVGNGTIGLGFGFEDAVIEKFFFGIVGILVGRDVGNKLSVGGTVLVVEVTTGGAIAIESGWVLKLDSAWGPWSRETNALSIRPVTKANGPRRVTHLPRCAFSRSVRGRRILGRTIFISSPQFSSTFNEISGVL